MRQANESSGTAASGLVALRALAHLVGIIIDDCPITAATWRPAQPWAD